MVKSCCYFIENWNRSTSHQITNFLQSNKETTSNLPSCIIRTTLTVESPEKGRKAGLSTTIFLKGHWLLVLGPVYLPFLLFLLPFPKLMIAPENMPSQIPKINRIFQATDFQAQAVSFREEIPTQLNQIASESSPMIKQNLREPQHTPGAYPRPPKPPNERNSET